MSPATVVVGPTALPLFAPLSCPPPPTSPVVVERAERSATLLCLCLHGPACPQPLLPVDPRTWSTATCLPSGSVSVPVKKWMRELGASHSSVASHLRSTRQNRTNAAAFSSSRIDATSHMDSTAPFPPPRPGPAASHTLTHARSHFQGRKPPSVLLTDRTCLPPTSPVPLTRTGPRRCGAAARCRPRPCVPPA